MPTQEPRQKCRGFLRLQQSTGLLRTARQYIGLPGKIGNANTRTSTATKMEYENRGFAKAVISECIKRGMDKGVKMFLISVWNEKTRKLYSSFGNSQMIKKVNYRAGVV